VRYQPGECIAGPAAFNTVNVGGLSVAQQQIGVPDGNAFLGDGVSEGVFELASPVLTSVWNSSDFRYTALSNHLIYTPFFLNAVEQGKIKDPCRGSVTGPGSCSNIAPINSLFDFECPDTQFIFYTVAVASLPYTFTGSDVAFAGSNNTGLDSGTTLNFVPTPVAGAYNAKFNPPARLNAHSGLYVVDCNATALSFSVIIGGKSFLVDPRDQISVQGKKGMDENTVCLSGTQNGGPDEPGALSVL
ncbi:aspartic peptidase domain-containing protein, partial [Mycena rosella]